MSARENSQETIATFAKASILSLLRYWVMDKSDDSVLQGNPVTIDFYGLNDPDALGSMLNSLREDFEEGLSILRSHWLSTGPIVEETLQKADDLLQGFPNIERKGTVLSIRGKVGLYDIDIIDGSIVVRCLGGHMEFRDACICLTSEKAAGVDSMPTETSRRVLIIALNLSTCDEKLLNRVPSICEVARCEECRLEGRTNEEVAQIAEKSHYSGDFQVIRTNLNWESFEGPLEWTEREKLFEDLMEMAYVIGLRRFQ